jgi:hypothetical protein
MGKGCRGEVFESRCGGCRGRHGYGRRAQDGDSYPDKVSRTLSGRLADTDHNPRAESQLKKFYDHARELGYLEKLIIVLPPIDDCVFVANHILHAPTRIHPDKLFIGGEEARKYQLWAILGLAHTRAAEVIIIIKEVEAVPDQSQPGPCPIAH